MHRFLLPLFVACSAILFLTACEKNKGFRKAMVIDSGDISTTGCGYLLLMDDGAIEKPVYLPSAFHHDSMKVLVKSAATGNVNNCNPVATYKVVGIEDIKRDLD